MSMIDKITVNGVDYDILPSGGQDGQALVMQDGGVAWGNIELEWENF